MVKVHDWDLKGYWFKPQCSHDKISAAVGPLSKAFNPTLLQGGWPPLSLINCKSLWIDYSCGVYACVCVFVCSAPDANCYENSGVGYRGTASVTRSGTRCLSWNSDLLSDELSVDNVKGAALLGIEEHAFCRQDPPLRPHTPWLQGQVTNSCT